MKYAILAMAVVVGSLASAAMLGDGHGGVAAQGAKAPIKTVRATQVTSAFMAQVLSGQVAAEFRQGDEIPVNFSAEGDLVETVRVGTTTVLVKRSFWLKMENDALVMSLDGVNFHPLRDLITGGLRAEASGNNNPISGIDVLFSAFLK